MIVSPQTVTLNTQFGAPVPTLTPGEVVEAQVLQILADGRARLAVAGAVIDVQTQVPLTVGTTVRLAVKNTPEGIKLTLLEAGGGRSPVTPATDIAPSAASKTMPGADVATARSGPATPLSGAAPSPSGATAATSVSISTAAAAATVGAAIGAATAASTGHTAAAATILPGAAGASSGTVAHGAPASLLEAQAAAPPALSPEAAGAAASRAALATAVRGAAMRQNSLAPLFADLAVAVKSPALPETVRQAATQVLALRLPVQDGLSAATLKQAFQRSGLFLESRLADDAATVLPTEDLKAALGVLRQVLKVWLDAEPNGKGVTNGPLAELRNAPPLVPGRVAQAPLPGQPQQAPGATAPPPYRDAPTAAQPEAMPLLSAAMAPEDAGRVLMRDTESALARQILLQAASVPDRALQASHTDTSGPRWHFEVPFAYGQGTAMAQFEIARDGHGAAQEGLKPTWRARFSIDVEPIGAVHAQVALMGERAAVTLWAERPESAARLRDNATTLTEALRQAELEPDVLVRDGAPPRPRQAAAPAGRFLDRAT